MPIQKQTRSIERRLVNTSSRLEVRKSMKANSAGNISGYAALYNSPSLPLPFTETIRKGAFDATLRDGQNKFLLYAHDDSRILASLQGDTLTLSSDDKGLRFSADVADTPDGQTVITLAKRNDLKGMSFGFAVESSQDEKWSQDAQGNVTRELLKVVLFEISCVGTGAYPKSFFDARNAPAAIRAKLRMAGSASDIDPLDDDTDTETDGDDDTDFSLCDDCRALSCANCARNFRSKVGLDGLPVRACARCLRSWCQRCFDAYSSNLDEDNQGERSRRRSMAALLLRLSAN